MTTVDEFLETVQEIARRENRLVEDVLESMVQNYHVTNATPPTPEDGEAYESAMRELRPKLYARARRYWQQVGDEQRLKLTDDELDELFWLFDNDGIPRLKSDEGQFELKPDPLEALVGLFDSGLGDLSTSVRETLEKTTHPKYGWTTRDRTD